MIRKYAVSAANVNPPADHVKPVAATPSAAPAASGPPTADGRRPVPAPGDGPARPQQAGSGGGVSKNVIDMQNALISLAKDVTAQMKVEDTTKMQDGKPARESGEAMGRISFNDFIAKRYLRKSKVQGVEFPTDPGKSQVADKTPGNPTHMFSIMDTMNRVGGGKAEFDADGKWGPRTNAALHNANAFASSMLKLAADFKLDVSSYNEAELAKFEVPESEKGLTPQQKDDYAAIYVKHVNLIHKMFNEIKAGILNNPSRQSSIELNQPFVSYKKIVPLSQDETNTKDSWEVYNKLPSNNLVFSFPQPGNEAVPINGKINYADLLSPQSFSAWLESPPGKSVSQAGGTQPLILAGIRKALQAKISGGA